MSNKDSHLKQAKRNEDLAIMLFNSPDKYKEWVVVTLFYSAVHYFESSWAVVGLHSNDHGARDTYIEQQYRRNIQLRVKYRALKDSGWLARYLNQDLNSSSSAESYFDDKALKDLKAKLDFIKKELRIAT